jgi:hypothetical protein
MDPRAPGSLQTWFFALTGLNVSRGTLNVIGITGLILLGIILMVGLSSLSGSSSSIAQDPEAPACLQAKGLRDSLPPEAKEYAPLQYYEAERWVRMNCDN